MEGKCSIPSISILSERFGLPNCSVGYISQTLTMLGHKIGNTLNNSQIEGFTFQICSDEIFAKQQPILITVDPVSMLILNIELTKSRKGDDWAKHWKSIINQQINFTKIIKDAGTGMGAGLKMVKEMSDIEQQIDTFHAVSHIIGLWVSRLLSNAYNAIDYEYQREILVYNCKNRNH